MNRTMVAMTCALSLSVWVGPAVSASDTDLLEATSQGGMDINNIKSTKVTIRPNDQNGGTLTVERESYDKGVKIPAQTATLTSEQYSDLWKNLDAANVGTLKDDMSLKGQITDAKTYTIKTTHNGTTNQFAVHGPQMLTDFTDNANPNYGQAANAIDSLVESAAPYRDPNAETMDGTNSSSTDLSSSTPTSTENFPGRIEDQPDSSLEAPVVSMPAE